MNERRQKHYTDQKLQGVFFTGLIIMEIILVSLLMLFIYFKINILIEDNLYNIHNAGTSAWPEIFKLLASATGFFVIINLAALYIVHLIWSCYVNRTIANFSSILDKVIKQDFTDELSDNYSQHHIVDLMKQWYKHEQKRQNDISLLINQLSQYKNKEIDTENSKFIRQQLDNYRRQLIGS